MIIIEVVSETAEYAQDGWWVRCANIIALTHDRRITWYVISDACTRSTIAPTRWRSVTPCGVRFIKMRCYYRPFSYCIDQAGLGAFTANSGRKHYNPPPLTVMWMNFDSPNFPSLCSLSAIISFQTCSNKCILYVLLFHKCIKIKYKTVNMYGVFLWLVQSSSRLNTIHSRRNYHVQLLSVRVGEFCHPARSR